MKNYILLIKKEISNLEHTLEQMKPLVADPLDPNLRLLQGQLHSLVRVYKDLNALANLEIDKDFYPDLQGILEENHENNDAVED